ncbi:MAG TPA: cytochrome-c peroxidase [Polyangiales bacterium]|nr:cytochrome-c peroxidase [Polyangiales bacterium]
MRSNRRALLAVVLSGCSAFETLNDPVDVEGTPRDAGRDARTVPLIDAGARPRPGPDGGVPAAPVRLQSLQAERPPPALSGGTLAVADDGSIAVAADPDRDRVYVIAVEGQAKVLQLPLGSEPGRVVLDGKGRAHVALRGAESLLTIDVATAQQLALTPVCTLPRGLAYDGARDAVVIACAGGELLTVAASTHAPIASVQLGLDLRDVVLQVDGSLLVTRYRSAELLHVSAAGQLLATVNPQSATQARFSSAGSIADGGLAGPQKVTLSPALAWKTVALPEGGALMLHQESQDDEISIGSGAGGDAGIGAGGGGGYGGGCETITQPSITSFSTEGAASASAPTTLFPHGLAVDLAISPDQQWVAVAEPGAYLQGQNTVEVLPRKALDSFSSCISGIGLGDYYQATAVAYDANGALYVFSREPAGLHVYRPGDALFSGTSIVPEREVVLALESVRDTGHELFHSDVGSGLSCAGCHGEALDDGHVWNFAGFGPRRTQTMRGGLLSTLPLHWEGDLASFQNLVDEVMTRRMGGFVVEPKFGETLAQWIDKQPPLQLGVATDIAAQRGKLLFESSEVGCATCHSGAHLTNNTSHDVGTGGLFQVPTLLGLALHPPFMHDGCAETLEARFDPSCGGGDQHGHTSQLTLAQITDLVSYLKTL